LGHAGDTALQPRDVEKRLTAADVKGSVRCTFSQQVKDRVERSRRLTFAVAPMRPACVEAVTTPRAAPIPEVDPPCE
jgi:hypothetical protein